MRTELSSMKRYAAHIVYCHPQRIISKGFVEVDEQGFITQIGSLTDLQQESHSTIFYNGLLLPYLANANSSFIEKEPVLEKLNTQFSVFKNEIKEGEKANLYLLQELDLVGLTFLKNASLTKLL